MKLLCLPLENRVHCLDALELMRLLPAGSVNAIITDLPYGTTNCTWDEIIPFAPMWAGDTCVVVLTREVETTRGGAR